MDKCVCSKIWLACFRTVREKDVRHLQAIETIVDVAQATKAGLERMEYLSRQVLSRPDIPMFEFTRAQTRDSTFPKGATFHTIILTD